MRTLIANEPAIYREVICAALKELRPDMEIFTSEPDDLEGEFLRILPQFVLYSRPTKLVEREAAAWVELYPGGAWHAGELRDCKERVRSHQEGSACRKATRAALLKAPAHPYVLIHPSAWKG
jgi:hypothetical protein